MLRLRSILQRCHPAHTSSPNPTSHLSPLEPFLPHHTRTGPFTSRRFASDRLAPSMALASVHRLSARGVRDDRIRRLSELETLAESSLARGWGLSKMVQCSVAGGGVEAVEERRGARMLEGAITTSSRRQVLSGLARIPPAPRKTPISVRSYSTTPRELRVTRLADEFEPATVVDLGAIMDDLRDLELLDALRGSKQKSGNGWKDAARCLYALWHSVDTAAPDTSVTVRLDQLQAVLPPIYSLCWSLIAERMRTGKVSALQLGAKDAAALLFLQCHGIGPKYAVKYAEAGARTLQDLENPDLLKLSRAQTIGLRHVKDINRLIPRSEMDLLRSALESAVAFADGRFESSILGSYRRGVPFSSDIDLVIRHELFIDADDAEVSKPLMFKIIQSLTEAGLVKEEDALTSGPKKYSGLIKLPDHPHFRRIDVRLAPYHSYPYMQLGSSGDALLMKLLRHTAKSKGWCLNEYGMGIKYDKKDANPNGFRPDSLFAVTDEKEIFELLGFPYLEPEQRDYAVWKALYEQAGINVSHVPKL